MDDAGRYVDANPAACQLLGEDREGLLGLTVADITPGVDRGRIPELMGQFLAAGNRPADEVGNGASRVVDGPTPDVAGIIDTLSEASGGRCTPPVEAGRVGCRHRS
jgi:PAS domain-containing protein